MVVERPLSLKSLSMDGFIHDADVEVECKRKDKILSHLPRWLPRILARRSFYSHKLRREDKTPAVQLPVSAAKRIRSSADAAGLRMAAFHCFIGDVLPVPLPVSPPAAPTLADMLALLQVVVATSMTLTKAA